MSMGTGNVTPDSSHHPPNNTLGKTVIRDVQGAPITAINTGGSFQVCAAEAGSSPPPLSSASVTWAEQGQSTDAEEALSWVGRNYSQLGNVHYLQWALITHLPMFLKGQIVQKTMAYITGWVSEQSNCSFFPLVFTKGGRIEFGSMETLQSLLFDSCIQLKEISVKLCVIWPLPQ